MSRLHRFLDSEWGRVVIAGSGFLADGYDLFVIGSVQEVIRNTDDVLSLDQVTWDRYKSTISSCALWGAVAGQLCFGSLADILGRRVIFVVTGTLIIVGSIASAICSGTAFGAQTAEERARHLLVQLAISRALLGFGIGGEYPLSASICAEGTSAKRRSTLMSLVFSNQGLGYLTAAAMMLILEYSGASLDATWRVALGFGAVIPAISLYFRAIMHESDDFKKVQEMRQHHAASAGTLATLNRYKFQILGTALNWCIFDICFYGNGIFNQDINGHLTKAPANASTMQSLEAKSWGTLIIVCMQLPGYYVAVFAINCIGRKNLQLLGLSMMVVLFLACGWGYEWLNHEVPWLFVLLYGLTFFFSDFGPNVTTYVIPGEIYPSQVKATAHGLSAACGKVGAAIGTTVFPVLEHKCTAVDGRWNFVCKAACGPQRDFSTAVEQLGSCVSGMLEECQGLSKLVDDCRIRESQGIMAILFTCSGLALLAIVVTIVLTPRYTSEDLDLKLPGETVGYVPLRWQLKKRREEVAQWEALGRPTELKTMESYDEIGEGDGEDASGSSELEES